jgi:hypothetical protein
MIEEVSAEVICDGEDCYRSVYLEIDIGYSKPLQQQIDEVLTSKYGWEIVDGNYLCQDCAANAKEDSLLLKVVANIDRTAFDAECAQYISAGYKVYLAQTTLHPLRDIYIEMYKAYLAQTTLQPLNGTYLEMHIAVLHKEEND